MFHLRFDKKDILAWAGRYDYPGDTEVENVARKNKGRGYLTKAEFQTLCKWKTPRSQPKCALNSEDLSKRRPALLSQPSTKNCASAV